MPEGWKIFINTGPASNKPILARESVYMAMLTAMMKVVSTPEGEPDVQPIVGVGYEFALPDTQRAVCHAWSLQQESGVEQTRLNETRPWRDMISIAVGDLLMEELPKRESGVQGLLPRLSFTLRSATIPDEGVALLSGVISQANSDDVARKVAEAMIAILQLCMGKADKSVCSEMKALKT